MYIFLEKFQIFPKLATNCYKENEFDKKYDTKIKIECEDNEGSYFDVTVNSALWSPQRTCI